MPRKKKVLERNVERAVVAHAQKSGCLVRKMNGLGYRGWPDRLFITEHGRHFYIEFKRPGEKMTEHQHQIIEELNRRGISAYCTDNVSDGLALVDEQTGKYPQEA